MVNVATKEEFDEFKKLIEDRLDKREENTRKSMDAQVKLFAAINTRLDDLLTAFGDLTVSVEKTDLAIRERVDEVEEKSKSLFTRIKEAIDPIVPE